MTEKRGNAAHANKLSGKSTEEAIRNNSGGKIPLPVRTIAAQFSHSYLGIRCIPGRADSFAHET
jgi:hypothetical protein